MRFLGELQAPNERIAIEIVQLPFLETIEWGESSIMQFLVGISVSDPEGLAELMSRESLNASDNIPLQILYVELKDPLAATELANQSWVKDGVQYFEHSTLNLLQEAAIAAPRFYSYMVQREPLWIPVQNGLDNATIYRLVKWSHFDEDTVLRLIDMPFLERINIQDGQAVTWLYELASADPDALERILSLPIVQDGVTDEESIYLSLYYLEETLPNAAAALQDLPWIQDGVDHVPWQPHLSSINVMQDIEAHEIISLIELAIRSPEFVIELTKKVWVRDSINGQEATTLGNFSNIIQFDREAAFRVLGLPLLDNHDRQAYRAVDRLFSATFEGREAFKRVLEELEAAGGS